MAEYIERDAAHRLMVGLTRYSWTSPISTESHVTVDADDVNFGLDKIPAADVAPVEPELRKAVELLRKEYEKAKQNPIVRDPLAYALFHAWKAVDSKRKDGRQ